MSCRWTSLRPLLSRGLQNRGHTFERATDCNRQTDRPCTSHPGQPAPAPAPTKLLTTPIFYPNARPHLGHIHSLVLTDVLARYHRLRHPDTRVRLSTGTDEHGLKIERASRANDLPPLEFCDTLVPAFRDLMPLAGLSTDPEQTTFIRTTDPAHATAVRTFWRALERAGALYKDEHQGWYAPSDETFYPLSAIERVPGAEGGKEEWRSIETGAAVEWSAEVNWKFRLSSYQDLLIDHFKQHPTFIRPLQRHRAILDQLTSEPLQDLSVSRPRSRLSWGIPVPDDPQQTIYVWLDALVNYLTVSGYPHDPAFPSTWPAHTHVIGKDIIRFHTIFWPAFLMAAGLPLPRQVVTHAHWLSAKIKMSKSVGNVVDPVQVLQQTSVGVNGLRYYLMRVGGGLQSDSSFDIHDLRRVYQVELLGQLGNLLSRTNGQKIQKRLARIISDGHHTHRTIQLSSALKSLEALHGLPAAVEQACDRAECGQAVSLILEHVQRVRFALNHDNQLLKTEQANAIIGEVQPWLQTTMDEDAFAAVYVASETLRIAGILLQPIIPEKAEQLLQQLGVPESERTWEKAMDRMALYQRSSKPELLFPSLPDP